MRLGKVHLSSSQIIILGFFLVIMAGALLLPTALAAHLRGRRPAGS